MVGIKSLLADRQRSLQIGSRASVVSFPGEELTEIVSEAGRIGVLRAKGLLSDDERSLEV